MATAQFPTANGTEAGRWAPDGSGSGTHVPVGHVGPVRSRSAAAAPPPAASVAAAASADDSKEQVLETKNVALVFKLPVVLHECHT